MEEKMQAQEQPRLQPIKTYCETWRRRIIRNSIVYAVIVVLGILAIALALYFTKPMMFSHPDFDANAQRGIPMALDERFGYSTLTLEPGYEVNLCGMPQNDGQNLMLNLTNPESNTIWLRLEVMNEAGELIGQTGVLKNGQYLQSVALDTPLTAQQTTLMLKLIAYEPVSWYSRGNINLKLAVIKGFS